MNPETTSTYSIGIDIGGTFTDFTVYDHASGDVHVEKVLTTPHAPDEAVFAGLAQLAKRLPGLMPKTRRVTHANTIVTNAILERKGVPTALVTTAGFRDVLETRIENRYNVYDLFIRYPEPIVPREHRYEVGERMYSDGGVRRPLSESDLEDVAQRIAASGVKAVAICFLHSYQNPAHERRAADVLRARLPHLAMSVSHEVSPEPREYQRSSTTVLDAYVKPLVDNYLREIQEGLAAQGCTSGLEIMLSNGGSATADIARQFPIQMIESGPAAGVEAASWMCGLFAIEDALSFDMGGTTAKLCILRDGKPERARKFEAARVHRFVAGSGFPVTVPVYDLVEIGAGGGSIARLDHLGLICVGPDSAGADPGPACYGQGGRHPTVTDADLVLGLLDPAHFLGGEMHLDHVAARNAIDKEIAQPLGLTVEQAAFGIHDLVNETMAAAARLHIAEKGCDPSRLTLIAFGGAGPLHAVELGRKLGCPAVLFPPHAGVMSSLGLLTAPPAFERIATVRRALDEVGHAGMAQLLAGVSAEVVRVIGERPGMRFRYVIDLWHRGQEYPLEVHLDEVPASDADIERLRERFRARYREIYGRNDDDNVVEVVSVRALGCYGQGIGAVRLSPERQAKPFRKRRLYDPARASFDEVEVIARTQLAQEQVVEGPLVIQDRESGIVIRAGDRLRVKANGAILVELGQGADEVNRTNQKEVEGIA
ncbi:MAG TPA: hydantoinase/oxoprolinase family protein [Variovorax sp.]|nr:hydantoinase/oxoprolinase family protein [Variovorax sp.]